MKPRQERSEQTRQRLLLAAAEVFGALGYEGATTRLVARKAGQRLSSITYYFGSKEGLFQAVMEQVATRVHQPLGPVLEQINQLTDFAPGEARELLYQVLDRFAGQIIASDENDFFVLMWIREQFDPTVAFEIIYREVVARVLHPIVRLVASVLGLSAEDPQCRLRALTIVGQILIFRTARRAALKTMGWNELTPERVEQIRCIVRSNLEVGLQAQTEPVGRGPR